MTLIDWYSYSNDHSDWFYDDQVHPNPEGMTHYIHLVSEALEEVQVRTAVRQT